MTWCEKNNLKYIVGIAGNQQLQCIAKPLVKQAEQQYTTEQIKQRLFADFIYRANTWKQERRGIVKVEHHEKGSICRFIMTNMKETTQALYDHGYCPRGTMENRIKQLKLDMFSDRNSCSDFLANQFRLLLSSIAYILIYELQYTHLSETQFKKFYCRTIRLKLFKIGAVILKNTRRIQFLL